MLKLKHSQFSIEMIQVMEAAMTRKEIKTYRSEQPLLLQHMAIHALTLFHGWLYAFSHSHPIHREYANYGYVHPQCYFVSDLIEITDHEPYGLFRIPLDRCTIGLTLKGLRLAFDADAYLQQNNDMLRHFNRANIKFGVQRILFIHRNPDFSPATIA